MDELEILSVSPEHEDDRGSIYKPIDGAEIRSILHITSEPGVIRANHYHKRQTQWAYVLEGSADLYFRDERDAAEAQLETETMQAGDMIKIPPGVPHAFEIDQYTELLEAANKRQGIDGAFYDEDTVAYQLISK